MSLAIDRARQSEGLVGERKGDQSGAERSSMRELPPDEQPQRDVQLESAIQSQRVRCPNASLGCDAVFTLAHGPAHLLACGHRTVQCPRCGKPTSAALLQKHAERCYKQCGACGALVPSRDVSCHRLGLCLARPHGGWRTSSQAFDYSKWRAAAKERLGWLVEACGGVLDWLRLTVRLETLVAPLGGVSEVWESAYACTALATECRLRGWRGPCVALAARASALEPTSVLAMVRHGDALLAVGMASAAFEVFSAALSLQSDSLLAMAGQAAAASAMSKRNEAAALWQTAAALPTTLAPQLAEDRIRWRAEHLPAFRRISASC
eukprot:6176316-Pleurochrysis_carterae.AAC.8